MPRTFVSFHSLPAWPLCILFVLSSLAGTLGCRHTSEEHSVSKLVFKHPRLLSDEEPLSTLLDQFRAAHPGVQLEEEILPSSSDQQRLFYVTNLEANASDFDVFALDVVWIPEFARAGWLHDLTPRLGPTGLTDFIASPVAAATQGGRVYAVPWFVDGGVLYYRRDLLDKYGLAPPRQIYTTPVDLVVAQLVGNPPINLVATERREHSLVLCDGSEIPIPQQYTERFVTMPRHLQLGIW